MIPKKIFLFGFLCGLLALGLSTRSDLVLMRWISGLAFVYFFAGYPLGLLVLPRANGLLERFFISSGLSLLLTYPAGFLNVLSEGQTSQAIFGYHLTGDLLFLLLAFVCASLIWRVRYRQSRNQHEAKEKPSWYWLFPVILATVFNIYKLGVPDLNGDEYDLGYQSYNLVDGIFAGRKAYALSFSAHPPLSNYIQHYTTNIISPAGLDGLADWMFRLGPALTGIFTIAVVYLLAKEIGSKRVGLAAASLLAVNGYQVFISRIYHREGFLTLYLALTIYILVRYLKTKNFSYLLLTGVFFGASMLVKASALTILPAIIVAMWWCDKKNFTHCVKTFCLTATILFLPVIIYNLGAYLATGYTDIFFSRIFQTATHPGARVVNPGLVTNLHDFFLIISDQFGILLSGVVAIAIVISAHRTKSHWDNFLLVWLACLLLFSIFNGVRTYYLPFIAIPLLVLTVTTIANLLQNKAIFAAIMVLLLMASFTRSSKTFFDYSFVSPLVDSDEIPSLNDVSLSSYSLTSRRWLENRGWKDLRPNLNLIYTANDCLIVDSKISDLSLRRYLELKDEIKRFYLWQEYKEPYKICSQTANGPKISILYDQSGVVGVKQL